MLTIQISRAHVVVLAALLFVVLAAVGTVGGLLIGGVFLADANPSQPPGYRGPASAPSGTGSSSGTGGGFQDTFAEWDRQKAADCERQLQQYQIEYTDYTARKGGGGFSFPPSRPIGC